MTASSYIDGAGAFPFRIGKAALVGGSGIDTSGAAFRATGTGYAGYATPTDMLTLSGAANRLVLVTAFQMQIQSTSAALQTLYFIKRSAPNTGGTASNPTPIKLDSNSAAAAATVALYSVIPDELGASAGTFGIGLVSSSTLANAPGTNSFHAGAGALVPLAATDFRQPFILREGECLAANYNGAALTGGFSATWLIEWVEFVI